MKNYRNQIQWALLLAAIHYLAQAMFADEGALLGDRTAVERVYYRHRLGEKPPFEQMLPPAILSRLVRLDQQKAEVLEKVYGVQIAADQVEAEVRRITATTRAPEILGDLMAALGNDPARFASAVAKPLVVERELRRRFENDDRLHASQRQQVEQTRLGLLAARTQGASPQELVRLFEANNPGLVNKVTWLLAPRPTRGREDREAMAQQEEARQRFGPQAELLFTPGLNREQRVYFEDLEPELQNVLRVQLKQPGDVSAVIEGPRGFLLYLAVDHTVEALSVAVMVVPKRSYEEWLDHALTDDSAPANALPVPLRDRRKISGVESSQSP